MRIACLLAHDFEDSEFQKPYDALLKAGHAVTVIGKTTGRLRGKRGNVMAQATSSIDRVHPEDFDALLIPGGGSPEHLRADPRMVDFTRAFAGLERPILAVCHGPQLLVAADAILGRRLTAWKTIQDDLRRMGENVVDEEVVVDGLLVTSRQPSDLDAFTRESLRVLEAASVASG